MADPTTTALVAVAYLAGHAVGDYWAQTDHQAANKSGPGWAGRRACAAHVGALTAAHTVTLALVLAATATSVHPLSAALGLTITAATHYWADRRWTLAALATRVTRTSTRSTRSGRYAGAAGAAGAEQNTAPAADTQPDQRERARAGAAGGAGAEMQQLSNEETGTPCVGGCGALLPPGRVRCGPCFNRATR